jgi:hypothetical protein
LYFSIPLNVFNGSANIISSLKTSKSQRFQKQSTKPWKIQQTQIRKSPVNIIIEVLGE